MCKVIKAFINIFSDFKPNDKQVVNSIQTRLYRSHLSQTREGKLISIYKMKKKQDCFVWLHTRMIWKERDLSVSISLFTYIIRTNQLCMKNSFNYILQKNLLYGQGQWNVNISKIFKRFSRELLVFEIIPFYKLFDFQNIFVILWLLKYNVLKFLNTAGRQVAFYLILAVPRDFVPVNFFLFSQHSSLLLRS